MDSTQFMGMLIASIGTLLAIGVSIVTLIIKPIMNLNKSIIKLNDSIDRLNDDNADLKDRVTKHGKEIDDNRLHLARHDEEIKHLKERLKWIGMKSVHN